MFIKQSHAQISASDLGVFSGVGNVGSIGAAFGFVYNLFVYLGWIGVILGVCISIFILLYRLIASPPEEVYEKLSEHLTRAVLIVITGIILFGAGFILSVIAGFLGIEDLEFAIPDVFN